ncbi:MAG: PTS sugar transporter subunit IIA [Rhabdochlamydiaceae bacterium]|nr:PTS sugar transporter subunit IIA [Rhabdochlamydiaceae bacterium]
MDLKIKDVAELLSVSETTIRRWLIGGKIPAYRLNHQYRFSRIEIENWMMSCKLDLEEDAQIYPLEEKEADDAPLAKTGTQQFSLFRALVKGDVLTDVPGKTKEEVIRNSMKAVAPRLGLDVELVTELLLDRERLMSTALNCGVAVPHPREFIFKGSEDRVIMAFPSDPVDFQALDKQPIHTLFFLFSSHDKRHLHLLAKIAHLSGSLESLDFLKSRPSKEAALAFIKNWEGKISG